MDFCSGGVSDPLRESTFSVRSGCGLFWRRSENYLRAELAPSVRICVIGAKMEVERKLRLTELGRGWEVEFVVEGFMRDPASKSVTSGVCRMGEQTTWTAMLLWSFLQCFLSSCTPTCRVRSPICSTRSGHEFELLMSGYPIEQIAEQFCKLKPLFREDSSVKDALDVHYAVSAFRYYSRYKCSPVGESAHSWS